MFLYKNIFKVSLLFLLGSVLFFPARATHVIGGELTYKCLYYDSIFNQSFYMFEVKLYRDCSNGLNPYGNAAYDNTIYVAIYDDNDSLIKQFDMDLPPLKVLNNNTYNVCLFSPPNICVEEAIYSGMTFLTPGHYYITYQRCCRNDGILNIVDPLTVGAGWFLEIPSPSVTKCNSSPYFKNYPPTIICVGDTFIYDHSAIDTDGDSLVYYLCPAYTFSQASWVVKPEPPFPISYLFDVPYIAPYNEIHPLGPDDAMQINPQTGLLKLWPSQIGKYVVAVCVDEYRNGVFMNTNKRDFQFNVAPCLSKVNAGFTYSITDCDVNKVKFEPNANTYATFYWYDFGVEPYAGDTSIEKSPVYSYLFDTFPVFDTTFIAMQIVNKGYSCADTAYDTVFIPKKLLAKFKPDEACVFDTIQFLDKSYTSSFSGNITSWYWTFGDGGYSFQQNPLHDFKDTLSHTVKMIIGTDLGCADTASEKIKPYPQPDVFAGIDVYLTQGESANLVASGAISFTWSPGKFLNDSNIQMPIATPLETTEFIVTGTSANSCRNKDTMTIFVLNPAIVLPNAFTPNNDGNNDTLYLIPVGIKNLIEFKIFNRWGEIVFETIDVKQGWDGNYKNEPQEIGTYVYYYKAETLPGKIILEYGNVALLR